MCMVLTEFQESTDTDPFKPPSGGRVAELGVHRYSHRHPVLRTRNSTMLRQPVELQWAAVICMKCVRDNAAAKQPALEKHEKALDRRKCFARQDITSWTHSLVMCGNVLLRQMCCLLAWW